MDRNIMDKRHDPADSLPGNQQRSPTVPLMEYFSRLMLRPQSDNQQEGREGKDWLKQRAFLFAERVLFADGAARELKVRDDEDRGRQSGGQNDAQGDSQNANGGLGRMLLRLCQRMVEVRAMTNLANQLSVCVANSHHFGSAWQLEFVLSNRLLAPTRVALRCDPPALHLRFDCPSDSARLLLQDNVMLLHNRLGATGRYRLTVEIESSAPAQRGQDKETTL